MRLNSSDLREILITVDIFFNDIHELTPKPYGYKYESDYGLC